MNMDYSSVWRCLPVREDNTWMFIFLIVTNHGQLYVGLYLPRPIFTHGQLYVAVWRVKSKKGLKVVVYDQDSNVSKPTTKLSR